MNGGYQTMVVKYLAASGTKPLKRRLNVSDHSLMPENAGNVGYKQKVAVSNIILFTSSKAPQYCWPPCSKTPSQFPSWWWQIPCFYLLVASPTYLSPSHINTWQTWKGIGFVGTVYSLKIDNDCISLLKASTRFSGLAFTTHIGFGVVSDFCRCSVYFAVWSEPCYFRHRPIAVFSSQISRCHVKR